MSFCDPSEQNEDYCFDPWRTSTSGHTDCALGWSDGADYGQLDASGCEAGCAPCLDYPAEIQLHADYRDGRRWLRPVGATRDAMGRRHDLRTGQAWPLAPGAAYEAGSCYQNVTGEECFNRAVCHQDCWPGGLASMWAGDALTCGDVALGEPVPDWFPDVFFYAGDGWPPYLYCRRFHFRNAQIHPLGSRRVYAGRLLGPAFPRFGQIPFQSDIQHVPCGANVLTACVDRFQPASCPSAYANDPTLPSGLLHWMAADDCRNAWDRLRLDLSGAEFLAGPTRSMAAQAALRTRALRYLATAELPGGPVGTRFDRLDHQADSDVGLWLRQYNGAGDCAVVEDARTVFAELPACQGPRGERLTVRAHILSAEVALYLIAQKVRRWTHPRLPDQYWLDVHARLFAGLQLAYTSPDLPGDPEDCRRPPPGVRFVDDRGRFFRPPRLAEWFGYRGHLGLDGPAEYPLGDQGAAGALTLGAMCGRAMRDLGSLAIPGWPSRRSLEDEPRAWPYGGQARIEFAPPAGACT